jgi:hypothetical protein
MMQGVRVAVALVACGLVSACDSGDGGTPGSTTGGEDPAGQYGEGPEIPWGVVMPDVQVRSLVTGLAGDMVITGHYSDTVDFGGGPLPAPEDDFGMRFMVGLGPAGEHRFSLAADEEPVAAVDPGGNTVFATEGSVTIAGQRYGSSIGKIDTTGAAVWVHEIDSSTIIIDRVACDASGRVWIEGGFGSTVTLGGEVFELEGIRQLFQIDADGAVRWAGTVEDIPIAMAVVDPDLAMVAMRSSVLGLDGEGNERWRRDLPAGMERFVDADVDDQGRTIVVGDAPQVAVDLGGGTLDLGWFMAIFGTDGEHLYSRSFGASLSLQAVRWAPGGGALVWGILVGEIDLGGGVLSSWTPEYGGAYTNYSLFLAVDDDGAHVWSALYPDLKPSALGSGPEGTALFAAKNTAPLTVGGQVYPPGDLLGRMPVTLD